MPVQNTEEFLLTVLSNINHREKQMAQFWDQLSQQVQDPDVKNALSVRSYLTLQDASNIEKAFQIMGKQMPQPDTRFAQIMLEDFRREYDAIQHPGLKTVYALWTIRRVQNFVLAEYAGLSTLAEAAGNRAVAALLEHNLADKVDFTERTRELFHDTVRQAIGTRATGRAA
jgi:ferritin-like metal-binding protein YciE